MATHNLTVVTYNLANYDDHKNWEKRLQMFVSLISTNQPDIIIFQETRMNPDQPTTKASCQDMAQQVLFGLQKNGTYLTAQCINAPIAYYPFNSYTVPVPSAISPNRRMCEWEGLSVISKFYVMETGTISLTKPGKFDGDLNPRNTQFVVCDLSNGKGDAKPFYVFNTHLAYVLDDAVGNATETVNYMKRILGTSNAYFLLAGDMNAEPDSIPIRIFKQSGIMQDLWPYFWGNHNGYTFPSDIPIKRIDYFFTSNELTKLCERNVLLGALPDAGTYASDHIGLLATFKIPVPNL